ISKNLDQSLFEPKLIVVGHNNNIAYDISNMEVVFLRKSRVLTAIPEIIDYLYRTKPQIVLSTIGHLNIAMGLISVLFPKIIFVGRQASINKISGLHSEIKQSPLLKISNKFGIN